MSIHTSSWSELAISLYEKLTERNAEITYEADNVEVWVPSGAGTDASHALWKVNGELRIRARDITEA